MPLEKNLRKNSIKENGNVKTIISTKIGSFHIIETLAL